MMRVRRSGLIASGALAVVWTILPAQAGLKISNQATQNVTCSQGVCTATAKKAVLNATDLTNMLASGDTKVASGSLAQDIEIDAALSWTSTGRLTLDSFHAIAFNRPVTVAGSGALTITTNDGGSGGDFRFFKKGHIEFWDTRSSLVINGQSYGLANSIKDLRRFTRQDPNGFYALAKSIDLKRHVYFGSPIQAFGGTLEGLGNTIANLTINSSTDRTSVGFIGWLSAPDIGIVRDMRLINASVTASAVECAGTLAGFVQDGTILNSYATGTVTASAANSIAGGLACENQFGTIVRSYAAVTVSVTDDSVAGGLVGLHESYCFNPCQGLVDQSFSTGAVIGGDEAWVGGLIGYNHGGQVSNGYATGLIGGGNNASVGGLIGVSDSAPDEFANPAVGKTYSTGTASGGTGATVGGFIGEDLAGGIMNSYWDLDTSGISDPSQGAGNIANDTGITGLTDAEFKSALPKGFKRSIWRQAPKINGGYPYLLTNPPH